MKTFSVVSFIIAMTPLVSAQELSMFRSVDTLSLRDLVFPALENSFWQPYSPLPFNPSDSVEIANLPPGSLEYEILSLPPVFNDQVDLSSSLKLQWSNGNDRYQLLRSALGYMMAGGEGYMLYRALKKYRYIH